MNAPSPSVPERPLIITTDPLSRSSARPETGACSRPGASIANSVGTFCRSIGGSGAVALISNFSGRSAARALPDTTILRSLPIVASALMVSMRFSTRSRRLENTTVPPVMLTCSMVALAAPAPVDVALGGGLAWRTRCSGRFRTGRTISNSVTCGRPDHRLASVTSAWMLAAVRRLLISRSFGSCSAMSFSVTLSEGQIPILVAPLIASR